MPKLSEGYTNRGIGLKREDDDGGNEALLMLADLAFCPITVLGARAAAETATVQGGAGLGSIRP